MNQWFNVERLIQDDKDLNRIGQCEKDENSEVREENSRGIIQLCCSFIY